MRITVKQMHGHCILRSHNFFCRENPSRLQVYMYEDLVWVNGRLVFPQELPKKHLCQNCIIYKHYKLWHHLGELSKWNLWTRSVTTNLSHPKHKQKTVSLHLDHTTSSTGRKIQVGCRCVCQWRLWVNGQIGVPSRIAKKKIYAKTAIFTNTTNSGTTEENSASEILWTRSMTTNLSHPKTNRKLWVYT